MSSSSSSTCSFCCVERGLRLGVRSERGDGGRHAERRRGPGRQTHRLRVGCAHPGQARGDAGCAALRTPARRGYGYPKAHLRTRPQWHVKASPSDFAKSYPVDIAVFTGEQHRDEDLFLVVECKKPDRRDGRDQLEDYLRLSRACLGVWTNGHERLFLRKREAEGKVTFEEIPNIPRCGQHVEDIGLF
ncbi:type I restriction enzyme HsdR N-terminal domain-containing protein [Schaalia hyovaginalis]|uniref:type I restriction enzyme HsdR N-terminal domain-containing protein n=1 Tax=Schaalia hyovaginalis TaxID=29316 RepID=UPI0038B281DE